MLKLSQICAVESLSSCLCSADIFPSFFKPFTFWYYKMLQMHSFLTPVLGIRFFSKVPWFLLVEMAFRTQIWGPGVLIANLGLTCYHCIEFQYLNIPVYLPYWWWAQGQLPVWGYHRKAAMSTSYKSFVDLCFVLCNHVGGQLLGHGVDMDGCLVDKKLVPFYALQQSKRVLGAPHPY